ncbi:MAG TPA: hypothetical protein VIK18_17850 [Pirellulales bacterium]
MTTIAKTAADVEMQRALDALAALPPADCLDAMSTALAHRCHDAMMVGHPWPSGLYSKLDRELTAAARKIGGAA